MLLGKIIEVKKDNIRFHHQVTVRFKEDKDGNEHGTMSICYNNCIFNSHGYLTTGRGVPLTKPPIQTTEGNA